LKGKTLSIDLGFSIPLQLVGTTLTVENGSTGASWYVGGSVFAAALKRFDSFLLGFGMVYDFIYQSGFIAPSQFAVYLGYEWKVVKFAIQGGLTMDFGAGSQIGSTVSGNINAGVQYGNMLFGYLGFFRPDCVTNGIGITYLTGAYGLSSGTGR
jgi:hypothetical protein